jgi:hypothetical protein
MLVVVGVIMSVGFGGGVGSGAERAAICSPFPKNLTQGGSDAFYQLLKHYKRAYIMLLSIKICRSVAFNICV